jgi:hypothetical protein
MRANSDNDRQTATRGYGAYGGRGGGHSHGYAHIRSRAGGTIAPSLTISQLTPRHNTRRADVTVNVHLYLSPPPPITQNASIWGTTPLSCICHVRGMSFRNWHYIEWNYSIQRLLGGYHAISLNMVYNETNTDMINWENLCQTHKEFTVK